MAEEQSVETLGANEKIGDYLRRLREARGLELSQLAKSIRLGVDVLVAIEESRWGYFKIEAYLRSYIVSICEKLSLDKNEVLKRLSSEINSQSKTSIFNMIDKSAEQKKSNKVPKVEIIIILIVIALLIFVAKTLNNKTEGNSVAKQAETEFDSHLENDFDANDNTSETEEHADFDSENIAPFTKGPNEKDTLRFECTPSPTDSMCAIKLMGKDTKMVYFRRAETRYVNFGDTSHITITVPERTRLVRNNQRLDYGRFNTILLNEGEIIRRYNRELR